MSNVQIFHDEDLKSFINSFSETSTTRKILTKITEKVENESIMSTPDLLYFFDYAVNYGRRLGAIDGEMLPSGQYVEGVDFEEPHLIS